MTNAQKLTIRASEIRQRLNEIAGLEGDALTDEVRSEETALQTEYRDTETRLRAAIAAEPDPETRVEELDAEARERLELRSKATLGGFLLAAMQGRVPAGAEAEYAAAFDAKPGHVPLDLWEGDRPAPTEERPRRRRRTPGRASPSPRSSRSSSPRASPRASGSTCRPSAPGATRR